MYYSQGDRAPDSISLDLPQARPSIELEQDQISVILDAIANDRLDTIDDIEVDASMSTSVHITFGINSMSTRVELEVAGEELDSFVRLLELALASQPVSDDDDYLFDDDDFDFDGDGWGQA